MKYILTPLLITLYPFLLTLANNRADVNISQTLIPLTVVAAAVLALALACRRIYNCAAKAAAVTTIFVFLFFSYGHIEDAMFYSFGNANDNILVFAMAIISLAAAMKIKQISKAAADDINTVFIAFAVTIVLFPLFTISGRAWSDYTHKEDLTGIFEETPFDAAKLDKASLPDIFHIYLDEYGRSDVLKEIYKIDNSEFINYLRGKGFFVADKSRCNYCYTDLSLLSTFNMGYLDKMTSRLDLAGEKDRSMAAKKLLWNNEVFKTAKKAGYKIITFNTGELYTSITSSDVYYSPFTGAYHNAFYINMLLNLTPLPVILKFAGADPYLLYDAAASHRRTVMHPFEKIDEILAARNGPIFVCLWVDSPHPPFVFDEAGRHVTALKRGAAAIDRWAIESEEDRSDYIVNYRKQLIFITLKTVELIDKLLKKPERRPVIILQSDHGPASRFEFEVIPSDALTFKERFGILNAVYLGGKDAKTAGLYESITPVNIFRIIFSLYLGADFKLLKDECFHSTWLKPYDFTNVSGR